MIEAITYQDMIADLQKKYNGSSKTFAILFVKPNKSLTSEEILNNISYFHHRSSNKLDIYMPGYGAYWGDTYPDSKNVCRVGDVDWSFSHKCYTDYISKIETISKWKHRGGSELMILDFSENDVDYTKVVRVRLEKALRDGAIESVEEFIEKVIRLFIKSKTAFGASDALTLNELGKSIADELAKKFSIFTIFKRTKHYTIYNYKRNNL